MLRSYALLAFCVTVWGSNFVFGAMLVEQFPPMLLSITRLCFTSTFYICYAWATGRLIAPTLRDLKLIIPLALIGTVVNQSSFYIGLQTADPTTSALILALSPITVGLLAAVFLRERFTARMAAGSVVALLGVLFVLGKGSGFHLSYGELCMVLAMLSFSVSVIFVRKLTAFRDPFFATVYGTVLGTGMLVPLALSREPVAQLAHVEGWAWLLAIGCAFVMQVVCGLVWNREMHVVGAAKASVFMNLQPFVAMVLGFWLLDKTVTWTQIVGSILIVGGVGLATVQTGLVLRRRKASASPAVPETAASRPAPNGSGL